MRLKALVSSVTSSNESFPVYQALLASLEGLDITTAEDLVLRYPSEELLQRLSSDKVGESHLLRLYDLAVTSLVPDSVLGSDLYTSEVEYCSSLGDSPKVGAFSLDSVLSLPLYGIVEIAGLQSTGKTLFVTQTILNYIIEYPKASVHWIDPLGVFSPERAGQVARQLELRNHKETEDPLKCLHVTGCVDIASVYDVLDGITSQSKEAIDGAARARFVVIDPITPLIGPALTNESSKGHAHMVNFMRHLATLSREHGLTCFLINTATKATPPPTQTGTAPPPVAYKPSLGPSYSYLTDMSLFLSRLPSRSRKDVKAEFKIKVTKFRKTSMAQTCRFQIDGHGLIV